MEPILLIHGYSAESKRATRSAIAAIYGSLPEELRRRYGREAVVEIDLSRYISLEDGITIEDLSRALDRVLRDDYPHLLERPFHAIVHSMGALIIRNWIRRFSRKPSPLKNLVYLAGASFGSGWAHIGKGQLAKWSRMVFQGGAERGVQVLDALELGSDWTLDLHLHFLQPGASMHEDYRVCEYALTGTQADVAWYPIPIRYAKEDGSDGVVRVASSNLNYHYLRFGPKAAAFSMSWKEAAGQAARHAARRGTRLEMYEIKERSRPGQASRPEVPFAIPYACAHTGEKLGIVAGERPREQVIRLLTAALETQPARWPDRIALFREETETTYRMALEARAPAWWKTWVDEPRAQYDHHAQIAFRVRDQDGHPVSDFDVFFDSVQGVTDTSLAIRRLFEDKHRNDVSPHIITFYLRTDAFSAEKMAWVSRIPEVDGCFLEVSAVEPETGEILYLPMRFEFTPAQLASWVRGHRTTIVDVELLRLPSPEIFRIARY